MTIEEKAKAYDGNYKAYTELINRLEDVKDAIKKQNYGIAMDILCKPYPKFQITTSTELKENEDERIRKEIIAHIKWCEDSGYCAKEETIRWITFLEKQGEKGTIGNKREIPNSEQKPAWSEEDENAIQVLKDIVRHSNEINENIYTMPLKEKLYNWLKSLKPQNTWKPSKEQMEALANALSLAKNCGEESSYDLRTLYEQLKKL